MFHVWKEYGRNGPLTLRKSCASFEEAEKFCRYWDNLSAGCIKDDDGNIVARDYPHTTGFYKIGRYAVRVAWRNGYTTHHYAHADYTDEVAKNLRQIAQVQSVSIYLT